MRPGCVSAAAADRLPSAAATPDLRGELESRDAQLAQLQLQLQLGVSGENGPTGPVLWKGAVLQTPI